MAAYLTFLLDLGAEGPNRMIPDSLRFTPDRNRMPKTAFEWRVTCDARGVVLVHGHDADSRLSVIATATWEGTLRNKRQKGSTPTEYQWELVEVGLEAASAARKADPSPYDDSLIEQVPPRDAKAMGLPPPAVRSAMASENQARPRPRHTGLIFGAVPAIVVFLLFGLFYLLSDKEEQAAPTAPAPVTAPPAPRPAPAPPPVPSGPATFDEAIAATPDLAIDKLAAYRVRWSEVDVPAQTTLAKVEKDPETQRGKRVCAEGTLERITRRDLANRRHYEGALVTADGDRVEFVVAGSTGELLKRDQARICGVVTGTVNGASAVFGMFDLPENRNPIVEAP